MRFYLLLICLVLSVGIYAQIPEKISYQAIVRNVDGEVIGNSVIGIKISILQHSTNGQEVYQESHQPITNENGLMTLEIGTGTLLDGSFTAIDWSNGPYFLETQMDLNGGNNYTITGLTELLSVPYALYAKTAGGISNENNNFLSKPAIVPFISSRSINETDIDNTIECTKDATFTLIHDFTTMKIGDFINLEAHNGAVLTILASEGVDLNYQNGGNAIFLSNLGNVRFGILRKIANNSYIVSGQ